MYKRISPVVKVNIVNSISRPVKSQNNTSSIYVKKFGILKFFLDILKMSNNIPIQIPVTKKANNMYN